MIKTYKRLATTLQDVSAEPPKERLLTFNITAPESAWKAARDHMGAASGADYEIYGVLNDALNNV